jgi:hypothetical protein
MMILRIVLSLLCFLPGFSAMSLVSSPLAPSAVAADPVLDNAAGVVGWINIEPTGSANGALTLAITGRALALRPIHGRYSLEVKRKGQSGTSNARQGGAIDLQPGAEAILSRSAVNIGPADSIDVQLRIFVDDREVFSAVVKSTGEAGLRL